MNDNCLVNLADGKYTKLAISLVNHIELKTVTNKASNFDVYLNNTLINNTLYNTLYNKNF